jgi:hypothetical protein
VLNIDSPPLSVLVNIPTIGIRAGPSRSSLTTGRRSWNTLRLEHQCLMVKNYTFWNKRMKNIFTGTRDLMFGNQVVDGYTTPTTPPTTKMERNSVKTTQRLKVLF